MLTETQSVEVTEETRLMFCVSQLSLDSTGFQNTGGLKEESVMQNDTVQDTLLGTLKPSFA